MTRNRSALAGASILAALALMSSCTDDSSSTSTTAGTTAGSSGVASTSVAIGPGEVTTTGISAERCAANKAAGKITYLTGFDYAAAASMADVIVAKDKGYFAKMCLDVEIRSSFSTANYPLVAADTAQFASGGSYAELLRQSGNGAKLEAVVIYGRTAIEALLVPKSAGVTKLSDLKGKTIGVKGDLPPVIVSMLNRAGLVRGQDYKEVLLDGFDPRAHLDTGIDALPVYKSNEPGQLTAAGGKYADYTVFDPAADGTPGSFGVIFTSAGFAEKHPSAVQDFVRADLRGWQDAAADPDAAVATAVKLIDAAGNPNFLSATGESFRWKVESKIVADSSSGTPVGVIDPAALQAQVDAYTDAKVFTSSTPIAGTYSSVAASVYDSTGKLIWPTG
jgi:NitT/TauT family transport system substrate-binding protein